LLRPDRLNESQSICAVLQMIWGGFRDGLFVHTLEDQLRQVLHHEMLCRAGLPWPPENRWPFRYWSTDPDQQLRNRQIYHGLRLGSLSIINALINKALEEAANPEALKQARRFPFRDRYSIYRAAAISPRVLQLTDAFPVLALAIYGDSLPTKGRQPEQLPGLMEPLPLATGAKLMPARLSRSCANVRASDADRLCCEPRRAGPQTANWKSTRAAQTGTPSPSAASNRKGTS
jgi:hypothetical protein